MIRYSSHSKNRKMTEGRAKDILAAAIEEGRQVS